MKNKNYLNYLRLYLTGGSIVDYLSSQGLASDWNTRKAMARRYGVTDYKGTADQNLRLMELIKTNQGMSPTTTMQGVPVTREVGEGKVETYTPNFTVKTLGYIDMSLYQKPVVQPLSFKLAFRNARNEGLAEFEWNGSRYNTALALPSVETKKTEVKQQHTEPRLLRVPDPITRIVISEVDPALRSNTLEYGRSQAEANAEAWEKLMKGLAQPWLRRYDDKHRLWYVTTPSLGDIKYALGFGDSKAIYYDTWKKLSAEDQKYAKSLGYHPDGVIGSFGYWLGGGSGESSSNPSKDPKKPASTSKPVARYTGGQSYGWRGIR